MRAIVRLLRFILGSLLLSGCLIADPDHNADGWSQDLLERLITVPQTETVLNSSDGMADGFILKSYQLRKVHLGDPGRGTNLVNILRRMLPPDSQVTEDRETNALHVLTGRSAHEAVLELVSAMDSLEPSAPSSGEATPVPEAVRKALETLAASQPDSKQLLKIVEEASREGEGRIGETVREAEVQAKASLYRELLHFALISTGGLLVGALALSVFLRRAQAREIERVAKRETASLALLPTQNIEAITVASREQQVRGKELQALMESFSIAYQADRQRGSMLIEAVAKKQGEITATMEQMQLLRHEIAEGTGRLFLDVNREAIEQMIDHASRTLQLRAGEVGAIAESASRKMDETAGRLEVQHAKAEALTTELERTQREVDSLFEKLRGAQEQAQRAENEAQEQRKIAFEKTLELTKREAALAGLSLLMQEPIASILETVNGAPGQPAETFAERGSLPPAEANLEFSAPSATFGDGAEPEKQQPIGGDFACPTNPYSFRIGPVT